MAGDDSEFELLMSNSVNPCDEDTEPNEAVLEHMSKLGFDRDQVLAVCICTAVSLWSASQYICGTVTPLITVVSRYLAKVAICSAVD